MQIENFDLKTGHVAIAEQTDKKGIVRLKEYQKPFYVFGKTKEKIKSLKRNDVVSIIKRQDLKINWLLMPQKPLTVYTADGSRKKYIWLVTVETKYSNGFYAMLGNERVFLNTDMDVKEGDNIIVILHEDNHPTFIQNCYCVIPNNLYKV